MANTEFSSTPIFDALPIDAYAFRPLYLLAVWLNPSVLADTFGLKLVNNTERVVWTTLALLVAVGQCSGAAFANTMGLSTWGEYTFSLWTTVFSFTTNIVATQWPIGSSIITDTAGISVLHGMTSTNVKAVIVPASVLTIWVICFLSQRGFIITNAFRFLVLPDTLAPAIAGQSSARAVAVRIDSRSVFTNTLGLSIFHHTSTFVIARW